MSLKNFHSQVIQELTDDSSSDDETSQQTGSPKTENVNENQLRDDYGRVKGHFTRRSSIQITWISCIGFSRAFVMTFSCTFLSHCEMN